MDHAQLNHLKRGDLPPRQASPFLGNLVNAVLVIVVPQFIPLPVLVLISLKASIYRAVKQHVIHAPCL